MFSRCIRRVRKYRIDITLIVLKFEGKINELYFFDRGGIFDMNLVEIMQLLSKIGLWLNSRAHYSVTIAPELHRQSPSIAPSLITNA